MSGGGLILGWMPGTHQATLLLLSWTGDKEYNETSMVQDKDRVRSLVRSLVIGTTTTKTVWES